MLLNDVLTYQQNIVVNYRDKTDKEIELDYNIHEYIRGIKSDKPVSLKNMRRKYQIINPWNFDGNKERFAREIVWFGRKGGKFNYQVKGIL